MSMFRLSLRYMKKQKKRTILTAVGIILSVALVSGSGILITSFHDMKLTQAEKSEGTWHYRVTANTDANGASMLRNNVLVQAAGLSTDDTCLQLRKAKSSGQSKPSDFNYLQLKEYDSAALSMMPYTVKTGRMPRNSGEIALESGAASLFPHAVKLGDRIALPFGKTSSSKGSNASEDDGSGDTDTFTETGTRAFTVVGFYSSGIYSWQTKGNAAVTLDPSGTHQYNIYVQMKPEVDFPSSIKKAVKDCGLSSADNIHENGLVEWMGKSAATKVRDTVAATFLILAAIILSVTALVIRNSFAMSVSEKISQIGMLRCLGASPAQIRSLVLSEALCIWAVALPIGLLCGLGAMAGVITVVRQIVPDDLGYLRLTASAWPFVATAVLSLAAVLLSARSPVRATMKQPMIEAVRGNAIYRGSQARKNKKGRFLRKLFGFPGLLAAKNIRRNPKQFRTTLISVVVSVILFLSVGGFSMAVNASIKQGINTSGGMDYTFSADNRVSKAVGELGSLETKVKSQPTVADVQKTPVYDNVNLNIPAGRIPGKYFSVYKEFKGNDSSQLLSKSDKGEKYLFCSLNVLEVSRENYRNLKFAGKAPSYDELLSSKGGLLCQTRTFVSSGGRIATADFANYKVGETISVLQNYQLKQSENDQAPRAKERKLNVRIMGILSEAPWYALNADGYLIVAQGNSSLFDTSGLSGASRDQNDQTVLEVRYRKGAEQEADAQMGKLAAAAQGEGFRSYSVYQGNRSSRNGFLVMEIFIVGFTVVIILISCVNVFNTIHANFQTRRREIAMTRAVGMDRKQLYQMLLLECSLYGLTGTFWGSIIGLSLQLLLLHAFGHIILADMQSPLLFVLISLAVSVGLGILAGWSSIRKMAKAPLVEEIRSEE